MDECGFYTFRGYSIKNDEGLSASMEDYVEMICRLSGEARDLRVNDLSSALNVQPPSTTRMLKKLSAAGYVDYEKYGLVKLTEKGEKAGQFLLYRHSTVNNFLKLLGVREHLLEQTEKIEHAVSHEMLEKMNNMMNFFDENTDVTEKFVDFYRNRG